MHWSIVGVNNNITVFFPHALNCANLLMTVKSDLHMCMFNMQNRQICQSIFMNS